MPRTVAARSWAGLLMFLTAAGPAYAGTAGAARPTSPAVAACPGTVAHPAPFISPVAGKSVAHIVADHARAWRDGISIFSGHVVLTYGSETVRAHVIRFNRRTNAFTAIGHVRVTNVNGGLLRAHYLHLNRTSGHGVARGVHFILPQSSARGRAVMVILRGRHHAALAHTRYSLCPKGTRVWYINASHLHLDYSNDVGTATNAEVVFKGVPIFYWPYISFPISSQRKSGFLPPRYGVVGNSGTTLSVPYYWNLAPNYDLVTMPEILTRRGLLLRNHFRYLGTDFSGADSVDYIPFDQLYGGPRYAVSLVHRQTFDPYWWAAVDYQRTSDPAFYTDFSTSLVLASQVDLPQLGEIGYSGRHLRLRIFGSSYELLDAALAPGVQPYAELPGMRLRLSNGTAPDTVHYQLRASTIRFVSGGGPPADRLDLYPSVSLPWRWPAGFLTPTVAMRETDYWLNGPTIHRTTPLASLKGGMMLEKSFAGGGSETLEPELQYLYIPYRNQQDIPIFDTAPAEFNYTDIFRTNAFFGPDRVIDANQLTAALTTRLYSASGRERLRASVGEIYYFHPPSIYLPPATQILNRTSDLAAEAYARITRHWYVRGTLEWNPDNDHTDGGDAYVEYHPRPNEIVTLGHRFVRGVQEEVDFSVQWPVFDHWSAMAETGYSLMQSASLDSYLGIQYNTCCWGLSFYAGRLQGVNDTQSTTAMFEFTLNGLGSLGSMPISPLSLHGFMLGP
ncbi:MAG: LPS-assembly protein LptD [Acidiferrobacter sp.]